MQIFIRPSGDAQCLYGEEIDLQKMGKLDIKRASHVEPLPGQNGQESWFVDLSPVGGPKFYGFNTRAAALKAEADWLNNTMRRSHVVAS